MTNPFEVKGRVLAILAASTSGKVLTANWGNYLKTVFPNGVHEAQEKEMQKAFFAGATVLLTIVSILGDEEDLPEQIFVNIMNSIWDETKAFAENLPDNDGQIIVTTH